MVTAGIDPCISIQELKFEEGKDETDIRNWSAGVDDNLKEYQGIGAELKQIVNEMNQEVAEKKDKVEQERRINLEKEIEKIKFEEKLNYEKKLGDLHSKGLKGKVTKTYNN